MSLLIKLGTAAGVTTLFGFLLWYFIKKGNEIARKEGFSKNG